MSKAKGTGKGKQPPGGAASFALNPDVNPDVTHGRKPAYSEAAAINSSDFDTKIFYMYREVITSLLISFPQEDVSNFLFGGPEKTNAETLKKMFNKDGAIETTVFDKVVWFSYNARNYANGDYNNNFFKLYPARGNFLSTVSDATFDIILASKSISLILCRYLFTVFKTIQERQKNQAKSGGGKGNAKNSNKSDIYDTLISQPLKTLIANANTNNVDIISTNCELFEKALFVDKFVDDDGTKSSYSNNIVKNDAIIVSNKQLIDEITRTLVTPPRPERRSCSRLVEQKAAADALAAEEAKKAEAERELKEQERLALIIETKKQMDAALAAAGMDYSDIKTIDPIHFSKDTGEYYLTTTDAEFLTYLAKTSCTLTNGSLNMLRTHKINDKSTVAGFFARLGLLQKSVSAKQTAKNDDDDDGDDGDDMGGGRGKNIFHQKGGAVILPEGFRQIGLRLAIEGIGAANQCSKAVGAIKDIPRIRCYICGELWLPAQKTMECEHIFCVGLAAQYFGLLRSSDFSEQQKLVLSILYAWAHRCCNQLKSNLSFMKFKNDPNEGFVFHENNATELLNNIFGNHSFDCDSVNGSIKKTFGQENKKSFTNTRKVVLSKYCRPLISEINDVRARLFFGNAALFSFMGILKIAATSLVLFTGHDRDNLAIKSKDMISLLSLFNEDIKVEARANKKRPLVNRGGRRQLQFGGTLDEEFNVSYVKNLVSLLKWNIESSMPQPVEVEEEVLEEEPLLPVIVETQSVQVKFLNESNVELDPGAVEIPINCDAERLNDIVRNLLNQTTGSWNFSVKGRPDDGRLHSISSPLTLKNVMESMGLSTEDILEIIYAPSGPPSELRSGPPSGPPSELRSGSPPPHGPNDILVFKLLAHTHAMNTHTIPNALFHSENSEEMMSAIAEITNNYWTIDAIPNGITKKQASVLQMLVLISPSTIHDRLDIQSTINTHYLREYDQLINFFCVKPLTALDMYKFCRLCLILCPGEIPSTSTTHEQLEKFFKELHEDIYLFVNNCHIEQFSSLKSKIKPPPQSEEPVPIDRVFVFPTDKELKAEESDEESHEEEYPQSKHQSSHDPWTIKRIGVLCEIIGYYYLYTNSPEQFIILINEFLVEINQKKIIKNGDEDFKTWIGAIKHHICIMFEDVHPNDKMIYEAFMVHIVRPFFKNAFKVVPVPPVAPVEEMNPPRRHPFEGIIDVIPDSPLFASQEPTFGFSPSRSEEPSYHEPHDDDVDTFLNFFKTDVKNRKSIIFDSPPDGGELTRMEYNFNELFHKQYPEYTVKFSEDINEFLRFINSNTMGGGGGIIGSKNKSSSRSRTRRKLRRNHRRTQYTNKHKRSAKSTKHATIKHRKSYRKHNRTIKRRKNSRRRNQ